MTQTQRPQTPISAGHFSLVSILAVVWNDSPEAWSPKHLLISVCQELGVVTVHMHFTHWCKLVKG